MVVGRARLFVLYWLAIFSSKNSWWKDLDTRKEMSPADLHFYIWAFSKVFPRILKHRREGLQYSLGISQRAPKLFRHFPKGSKALQAFPKGLQSSSGIAEKMCFLIHLHKYYPICTKFHGSAMVLLMLIKNWRNNWNFFKLSEVLSIKLCPTILLLSNLKLVQQSLNPISHGHFYLHLLTAKG